MGALATKQMNHTTRPSSTPPGPATRPQDQTFDVAAAAHLFRRVGFGARRDVLDRAVETGFQGCLDELMARRGDEKTQARLDRDLDTKSMTSLQGRWMSLILGDTAPLVERVTLMWHNHFATSNRKVGNAAAMHRHVELLRELGLGDFRVLLHAVAKDPAMLRWLDGTQNKVGAPNENFAREVMELFGLGIGAGYTEADIKEAARAFSGWSVADGAFVFKASDHDKGEKTLFGKGGVQSGEDALDRVLAHPECSRWIAKRLLVTFVHPEPRRADVVRFGKLLVENEWNIGRTLRRIFLDPLFMAESSRRSRIASPVELVAGVLISTGAPVEPLAAARAAGVMGQTLYMPPSVKGWDGGRSWIDPGTWLARHNWLSNFALAKGLDGEAAFGASLNQKTLQV